MNLEDVRQIASAYDRLRQLQRQNPKMVHNNDDPKMASSFEKTFQMLVRKMKSLKSQ